MKKKLLSLLLALCLVMALVPMTAFAEGTSVDNWDGTADTAGTSTIRRILNTISPLPNSWPV